MDLTANRSVITCVPEASAHMTCHRQVVLILPVIAMSLALGCQNSGKSQIVCAGCDDGLDSKSQRDNVCSGGIYSHDLPSPSRSHPAGYRAVPGPGLSELREESDCLRRLRRWT